MLRHLHVSCICTLQREPSLQDGVADEFPPVALPGRGIAPQAPAARADASPPAREHDDRVAPEDRWDHHRRHLASILTRNSQRLQPTGRQSRWSHAPRSAMRDSRSGAMQTFGVDAIGSRSRSDLPMVTKEWEKDQGDAQLRTYDEATSASATRDTDVDPTRLWRKQPSKGAGREVPTNLGFLLTNPWAVSRTPTSLASANRPACSPMGATSSARLPV